MRRYRRWIFLGSLFVVALLFLAALQLRFRFDVSLPDGEETEEWIEDLALRLPEEEEQYISVNQPPEEPPIIEAVRVVEEAEAPQPEADQHIDEELKQALDALDDLQPEQEEEEPQPILTEKDVDEIPRYKGGLSAFVQFLTRNLHYPNVALQQKKKGKVVATFVVNADGSIADLKIEKHGDPLFEQEALRVLQRMDQWQPGKKNGKPCRTLMGVPIVFGI